MQVWTHCHDSSLPALRKAPLSSQSAVFWSVRSLPQIIRVSEPASRWPLAVTLRYRTPCGPRWPIRRRSWKRVGGRQKKRWRFFFLSPKVFSPWKHVRVILYRNINMILYPSLRFLLSTQHDNQIIIKKIKIYTLLINNYFIKLSLLVFFFLPHCH